MQVISRGTLSVKEVVYLLGVTATVQNRRRAHVSCTLQRVRRSRGTLAVCELRTQLLDVGRRCVAIAAPQRFRTVCGSEHEERDNVRVASSPSLIVNKASVIQQACEYQTPPWHVRITNQICCLK